MSKKSKKNKKNKPVWLKVDDDEVRHIWADPDGKHEVDIGPNFYAEAGVPICSDDSEHDGDDMVFVRTEISPRLAEALAFRATVEPILQHIFDVLYFDSDKNGFDPNKEWGSAADFLWMIDTQLLALYGKPKARSTEYPKLKLDG